MDDQEPCDPAISLKNEEEAPAGTEQETENNNEANEMSVPGEQNTGQCAMPR